jgi:hypothetical protein
MKEKLITAEAGTSLFQPDLLLPAQFFAALKQKAQACGERRLMVAILEDAVVCFQKHLWATDGRSRQLGAEAERWFLSDDSSWPFSFVNICEALDIHPLFLRRGLLTWKAQQLARRQAGLRCTGLVSILNPKRDSDPSEMSHLRAASGT